MSENIEIVEDMKKLGLTEYEAKAYLKLLEMYPVNGYVLSKNSGIPRSRIYEVLDSLKKKQIVFEVVEEGNSFYKPLEPKLLVSKMKNNYDDILKHVDKYTEKVHSKKDNENELIVIKGRKNIIDLVNTLISEAEERVVVSVWEKEILEIEKSLNIAKEKGVTIKGIYFGENNPYKEIVSHRRIERYISEKNERFITIVIDKTHVVTGFISRGEESQITWTKDIGIAEITEDYISHDVMINVYANKLNSPERKEFESYLDNVRKEFFGFTDEEFKTFK